MAIKHTFVNSKADDADATITRPSDWNADHTIDVNTITDAMIAAHTTTKITTPTSLISGRITAAQMLAGVSGQFVKGQGVGVDPIYAALVAADIPFLDTSKITTGRFTAARLLDGTSGQFLKAQGAGIDPIYAALVKADISDFAHKDTHKSGGSDAFVKADVLIARSRYLEDVADPLSDQARIWIEDATKNLKYWDDQAVPVKQTAEIQSSKGVASGYCDLDASVLVPLSRLAGIVDAQIGAHTSTKITITAKSQLNSALLYNDQNNALGAFYEDLAQIVAPANPAAGTRRVFVDSVDGKLKVRTSAGTSISLEEQGGASLALNDLTDVIITTPAQSHRLLHNGTDWVNKRIPTIAFIVTLASAWSSQPSADTELLGLTRFRNKFDLTDFNQFRLVARVDVAGVAGADIRAQYSTDESTWNNLDGVNGPELAIDAIGTKDTAWTALPAGAKADVFLRIMGKDGDGVTNPDLGTIAIQIR